MTRVISAVVLVLVLAFPVIFGPVWMFYAVALPVVLLCIFEFMRACLQQTARLLGWIVFYGALPLLWFIMQANLAAALYTMAGLALAIITLGLYLFEREKASAREVAISISGLIYPLFLLSFWILLRGGTDGRFWMIFGIVCTFLSDSGAYYVGKNFGKRKLAPRLSPKKTWAGLYGGTVTSIIGGIILWTVYPGFQPLELSYPLWLIALLGLTIALLDLIGDLCASMFKREFNIKDLGNLIPGHGGMLDRMDGIVPVGAALYLILQVFA